MRLALALVLLSTSAYAAPAELQSVNDHFNQSIRYRDYGAWDFRYLPNGGEGNCATIAYNKWRELQTTHPNAKIQTCELLTGQWHAFVEVDGWVLDNRHQRVGHIEDVGCGHIVLTASVPGHQ